MCVWTKFIVHTAVYMQQFRVFRTTVYLWMAMRVIVFATVFVYMPYVHVHVGRWGQWQKLQTLRCTCSPEKWNLQVTDLEEPARITVATRSKQQKHTVHRNTLALYRFCCIFHCGHDNITAQFSINFKELNLSSMSRYILRDVIWQLCLI